MLVRMSFCKNYVDVPNVVTSLNSAPGIERYLLGVVPRTDPKKASCVFMSVQG